MAVEIARVRALIATLAAVSAAPHFHRTAFRTPRKTFATLDETGRDLNLMFDRTIATFSASRSPRRSAPFREAGAGWARRGAT